MRTSRRLTAQRQQEIRAELAERWPRIGYAFTVSRSGYVHADYLLIVGRMDYQGVPGPERAETWEELARFYEWHLDHRADELAYQESLRYLVAIWTDSMTYSLRRSAAYARGDDPGPVITQSQRRPDLFADRRVRLDGSDGRPESNGHSAGRQRQLVGAGVAR